MHFINFPPILVALYERGLTLPYQIGKSHNLRRS